MANGNAISYYQISEKYKEEWEKGKKCYDELYKILKEIDKKKESK